MHKMLSVRANAVAALAESVRFGILIESVDVRRNVTVAAAKRTVVTLSESCFGCDECQPEGGHKCN
ncbi:MAG: hypothetical protein Fues2KO_17250 [Fuerstiella sp.]